MEMLPIGTRVNLGGDSINPRPDIKGVIEGYGTIAVPGYKGDCMRTVALVRLHGGGGYVIPGLYVEVVSVLPQYLAAEAVCEKCGSNLTDDSRCSDETCPFSD